MKILRSSATRMVEGVGVEVVQRGAGAGFVPFIRMWKGDQGPCRVGALETDMLFGHCALGGFSIAEIHGTRSYLFIPPHCVGSGTSTPILQSRYFSSAGLQYA